MPSGIAKVYRGTARGRAAQACKSGAFVRRADNSDTVSLRWLGRAIRWVIKITVRRGELRHVGTTGRGCPERNINNP
jgi:hypothetical protein